MSTGQFKAGHFYFPTSTGSFAVTGLGFQPQGILFFGGNQATEDAFVSPSHPGLFIGMAWLDVDTGLIDFQVQSNTTIGWKFRPYPILMLSSGVTEEYRATSMTFDSDGFTLSVDTAAPASRLVHYLAWGTFTGTAGKTFGSTVQGTTFDVAGLGYRPLSALNFSHFAASAVRSDQVSGVIYHNLGVASFPEVDPDLNLDNATAISFYWPIAAAQGWTYQQHAFSATSLTASIGPGPAQTWETDIDVLRPWPNWTSDGLRLTLNGWPNRSQLVWWDCESSVRTTAAPDVGDTTTATAGANIDKVTAVLFFGTGGHWSTGILSVPAAYTIGVLTKDYQGVVAFNAGLASTSLGATTNNFFQSRSMCSVEGMYYSGGRAASGVLSGKTATLTGEINSTSYAGNYGSMVFMLGPHLLTRRPQIYRRIPAYTVQA